MLFKETSTCKRFITLQKRLPAVRRAFLPSYFCWSVVFCWRYSFKKNKKQSGWVQYGEDPECQHRWASTSPKLASHRVGWNPSKSGQRRGLTAVSALQEWKLRFGNETPAEKKSGSRVFCFVVLLELFWPSVTAHQSGQPLQKKDVNYNASSWSELWKMDYRAQQ